MRRVNDDAARIDELERGFRRDGLPNLIVDYSATEDVFTKAIPFLTLVFVVEVVTAINAWKRALGEPAARARRGCDPARGASAS